MKICPQCSFSNDERFPTCGLCNAVLVDVPSTPSADPDDPEHERRTLLQMRHTSIRRQMRVATILYALAVTLTAAFPGLVWSPQTLLLYFISSIVVAIAVTRDIAGQFSASFLQGLLSFLLLILFGPMQPFIFFVLVGHIVFPAFLWHWTDMIRSANR